MELAPLGDAAAVVTLGATIDESTLARVRALTAQLEHERIPGIVEVVPAYATVTVFYEPHVLAGGEVAPFERVRQLIAERLLKIESGWSGLLHLGRSRNSGAEPAPPVEIPVCYGGELGPDLEEVAQHAGLGLDQVIALHGEPTYLVHAIGFTPGFCYLGGLSPKLYTPRRATPRAAVPAGSVGIGWQQTGVYPLASPGGWQIVGRTPLALFQPQRVPAALLSVGAHVKFKAIAREEFVAWK